VGPEITDSKSSAEECSSFANSSHADAAVNIGPTLGPAYMRPEFTSGGSTAKCIWPPPSFRCVQVSTPCSHAIQRVTSEAPPVSAVAVFRRRVEYPVVMHFRCRKSIAVALRTLLRPAATRRFPAKMHGPISLP
jgi:hypothetical protein